MLFFKATMSGIRTTIGPSFRRCKAVHPSCLPARWSVDYFGSLAGHEVEMSDAPGAFTQSELQRDETWITLPREQWPKSWEKKDRRPVVKLRLALYGRPLAGCCWEQKWTQEVRKHGFEPVPDWESVYFHPT